MNFTFLFDIEYNDFYGQFALIIVLNLELFVWTVWEDYIFMVDPCFKVNIILFNLIKFLYNVFLVVL